MELTTLIDNGTIVRDRYLILKPLGRGGFGQTYLVQDQQCFQEICVLKQFAPVNTKPEVLKKSAELFNREAEVLYSLAHPQIPKLRAYFQWQGKLFLVQDFIEGKNYLDLFCERQEAKQGFTVKEIVDWLLDLLPVLDYIHQKKLVHRDIAPDNIMFSEKLQKPVLIDFGIVRNELSNSTGIAGRYGFSAPEQIRFGQCYPSSDLYSLAVTTLFLLTGRKPEDCFDGQTQQWQFSQYVRLDQTLTGLIYKMLAEKPQNRYQSASEILAILQPYRQHYEQKTTLQVAQQPTIPVLPIIAGLVGVLGIALVIPNLYPLPLVCQWLNNCQEESSEAMIAEAEAAIASSQTADSIPELQSARDRLFQAMEELTNHQSLSKYEEELQDLEIRLSQEQELADKINLLKSQMNLLKLDTEQPLNTVNEHHVLQSKWQELKIQLEAIPSHSFAYESALPMLRETETTIQFLEAKLKEIKPLW